ncbi:T9SS C-terminal target domain-containing [Brachionus plicatilis]|uniref:T9SS C-terminal target domain-containing n=1 Tax=Brachionus plicatilis TaxID=10195 RepID=A0A3M7QCK4_BRAPC|nr:T9SS C-terminal target domain-containing [Brachionus plicatilis]
MKLIEIIILSICLSKCICQINPIIAEWTKSTGSGYGGFNTNVYKIEYSSSYVWVSTNSIPSFSIGPWANNPNNAKGMDYTFQFPLNPTYNIGTPTKVPLGHIGLWINGVSVFNADDGMTYNNLGVWKRNAYIWEGVSFDSCKGHPNGKSEYHMHISSGCLYNTSASHHSPLIGFAFDGFPIYGPYGYSSANDSSSSIKRIETSYKLRSITDRTSLPDGTVLDSTYYGPSIASYNLSSFIEDYEYQTGYGDLDEYNGRYCKTPEYPDGIYAYFIATDSSLTPIYPFVVGPYYRGNILPGNTGPNSGKLSAAKATVYFEN